MTETTREQLVSAASKLLDSGGQAAVTMRAVAEEVGVSHNASYWHFRDRSALLAAVAERDFVRLRRAFEQQGDSHAEAALRNAAAALINYSVRHKARYRLLFSDPGLSPEQSLKDAAVASFQAFSFNTVHFSRILIAFLIFTGGSGLSDLRRSGKLLIFRLTPRLLRRCPRRGKRSWRISSSTAWCQACLW
jgi:AcrR family transcriptional regulator